MNLPMDRDFLAQGIIVLAICIGAWIMLVQPRASELAELERAESQSLHGGGSGAMSQEMIEGMVRKVMVMKQRAREIALASAVADDSSRLYGQIMDLADKHGVQVQSLQPGSDVQTSAESEASMRRIEMTITGAFGDVCAFLDSIDQLQAFVRPVGLQVTPATTAEGRQFVTAAFSCEALSFRIDPALSDAVAAVSAAPAGDSHAQP